MLTPTPTTACLLLVALLEVAGCTRAPAVQRSPERSETNAAATSDAGVPLVAPTPADAAVEGAPPDPTQQPDAGAARAAEPTPCPSSLDQDGLRGPCTIGERCEVPDGVCFCDGYHGGIPPQPGVDYSHWVCGRARARTDGCPDDIVPGARCPKPGQRCFELEGPFCGVVLECRRGQWVPEADTCSTIP